MNSSKGVTIAANCVMLTHAAFALFVVVGGLLMLLDFRFAFVHLPVVAWSSIVNLARWTCPLTPLERKLRTRAGQTSFEGGWIQHYIEPLLRALGMPGRLEPVAGVFIVAWNVLLYAVILWWRSGN